MEKVCDGNTPLENEKNGIYGTTPFTLLPSTPHIEHTHGGLKPTFRALSMLAGCIHAIPFRIALIPIVHKKNSRHDTTTFSHKYVNNPHLPKAEPSGHTGALLFVQGTLSSAARLVDVSHDAKTNSNIVYQ